MKSKTLVGGGVAAAVLASSCCILPFIVGFIGVGAGALGFFSVFEKYRIPLIVIAAVFLGYAFFKVYKVDTKCGPDGTCNVNPRVQKLNKIMLWSFTALAVFAIFFPQIISRFG